MISMNKISVGNIEAKPGTKVTGFLPSIGLKMPDGTNNFWNIPVIIINGVEKGPVFEVDGCIHGEEQEGAYTVLELARRIDPQKLKGTFIGVPVLNVPGFLTLGGTRGSITDKMYIDMNRQFPGDPESMSHTRRAIHTFWNEIIKKCDYTINLHGCLKAQIPRVVYNEEMPETYEMAKAIAYTSNWVIASRSEHTRLKETTINWACTEAKIPNVFIESGSSNRNYDSIKGDSDIIVNGILNCMKHYEMVEGESLVPEYWRKTDYYTHVRGKSSGIIYPEQCLKMNTQVKKGDLLCRIMDFLGNEIDRVYAPHDGIIIMESNEVSVGPDSGICLLANTPTKFKANP
jgi:predicted deacylase